MYAQPARLQHAPRAIGIAGAAVVYTGVIAVLIFAVPKVIPFQPPVVTEVESIPVPPDPPPIPEPTPQPKTDQRPREEKIWTTKNVKQQPQDDPMDTTRDVPETATTLPPGNGTGVSGEATHAEPRAEPKPEPKPLPLVAPMPDPKFAKSFQPPYPSDERRKNREGLVKVRVLVGADGRVRDVTRISATSDSFFEATRRKALSDWRYRPARRGNTPIESWTTMTVRFQLENE